MINDENKERQRIFSENEAVLWQTLVHQQDSSHAEYRLLWKTIDRQGKSINRLFLCVLFLLIALVGLWLRIAFSKDATQARSTTPPATSKAIPTIPSSSSSVLPLSPEPLSLASVVYPVPCNKLFALAQLTR
jgi:hypothetical protein